jgi:hypothetical protein
MIIAGQVGPQVVADGAQVPPRLDRSGAEIVQELHGRYYEQTYRGNMFSAPNSPAQAYSVGLSTTYTGLLIYNPVGSKVNLVPNKVKLALSVAPVAIASIGLLAGFSATGGVTAVTTSAVVTNNVIGSPKGTGLAYSSCTIVTPVWLFQLYDGFTAGAFPNPTQPVDLEGLFIIPPGGFIGIGALTAVTGFGSIAWEEVPL